MADKRQATISVLIIIMIIILVIFFWIAYAGSDLGSNLTLINANSATQTSVDLNFSINPLIMGGLTDTPTPPTSTFTPTSSPTPTATSTATPTLTPTLSFTGYEIIGFSVLERPLEVYRFGTGEHPHMIVAGIHGGYEWNTVHLAYELIELLEREPDRIPADKTLYILPNLNPDGYAKDFGPDGRANANNVDINRNWDSNWQANWYGSNCWSYRFIEAGDGPESEPETRALKNFLLDRKIEAVISYHSMAYSIFSGGYPYDSISIDLANALAYASPYAYPPYYGDCLYTGQFVDWASDQGIAAVDIELKNHVDTDYLINVNILDAFLDWDYPEQEE